MRTARLLPVSPSMHYSGGECTGPGGVPGPGGCTWSRRVYLVWGGWCTWFGGCTPNMVPKGVPGPGGCTWSQGVGVPGPGGCTWSQGGCTCLGQGEGGTCWGGVPAHVLPPPPRTVNRMTGAKYYLAPNFVCGR